jgi:hypothetical protein
MWQQCQADAIGRHSQPMQPSRNSLPATPFLLLLCGLALFHPGCVTVRLTNEPLPAHVSIKDFSAMLLRTEALLEEQRLSLRKIDY